jgi:Zn-dependent M28 family amino/carboxypeptidase
MLKKISLVLLLVFCTSVVNAQQVVDLKKHVEYLSSDECEGRHAGTKGCDKAADYLFKQLQSYGYTPEYQAFDYGRRQTKNVLAIRKGSLDTVIVIGAHYDAVGPGADDNASGTAAVLELARMFPTARRNLVFILFSAEEMGLYGSSYYVKNPKFPNNKTIFMLNLDMIGYLKEGRQYEDNPDVNEILKVLYGKYPFAQSITIRGGTASDQEPFDKIGIPVAFLHTGLHRNYHKPSDTAEKLNYEGMVQIVKYSYDLIKALDTHDLPDYNIIGKQHVHN